MYPATSENLSYKKVLLVILSVIVIVFVFQWISSPMVITITGVGEASAPATAATLSFSVGATGDNSATALANVKARANKIREVIKGNGVLETDIYQSQATVYPTATVANGATGFTASTSIGFKTTDVLSLDVLTSTIYAQGASVVTQPVLSAKDNSKLSSNAYQLALKDANKQASQIGLKNFKFIKKVVLIQENAQSAGSMSITNNGDLKVSKVLSVSYKLW